MRFGLVAPPIIWAGLIFYVSSLPNPPGQPSAEWASYAAHLTEFAALGFLVARLTDRGSGRRGRALLYVVAWIAAAAYGASDEVHQAFVPGRDASAVDWLFDATGTTMGVVAWAAWSRLRPAR